MNPPETKISLDTSNVNSILKELSDIKANLAVNSNETQNIKTTIGEVKTDLKEIKNDFVNRRELGDILKPNMEDVALLKKIVYGMVSLILVSVLSAVIYSVVPHR